VTTRTILLTMHIAMVAAWLGADVMQYAMRHRWARETAEASKAWARMQFWLHDRYYSVVAVLTVASGIALVQSEDWGWSPTFIWVGLVTFVLGATLGGIGLKNLAKKRIDALDANDTQGADAATRRSLPIELLLTALVLVTVVGMVHKWGA
jgi:hypothetical protein